MGLLTVLVLWAGQGHSRQSLHTPHRMSGPAITKYEVTDHQVPGADYPPSYAATMSGQVDAPPAPYPPQAMQQQPQVITQVQYVAAPSFGRNPATLVCPQCQKHITTRTSSEPSTTACIIPCCMDSMQTVTHSCPSCNSTLGRCVG